MAGAARARIGETAIESAGEKKIYLRFDFKQIYMCVYASKWYKVCVCVCVCGHAETVSAG